MEHVSLFRRGVLRTDACVSTNGFKKTVQYRLIWSCKHTVDDGGAEPVELHGMAALRTKFEKLVAADTPDVLETEEVNRYRYFLHADQREKLNDIALRWSAIAPAVEKKTNGKKTAARPRKSFRNRSSTSWSFSTREPLNMGRGSISPDATARGEHSRHAR